MLAIPIEPVVAMTLIVVTAVLIVRAKHPWREDCGREDCDQRHNPWHRHAGPDGR